MWNGTSSNIPNGYVLCNGSQYTDRNGNNITSPNMTDKFVKGVAAVGTTGGNHSISRTVEISGHELSRAEIPSHTHGMNANFFRHTHNLEQIIPWAPAAGDVDRGGFESRFSLDDFVNGTTGTVRYAGGSDFPGDW